MARWFQWILFPCVILAAPATEFLLLRFYVRNLVQIKLGFPVGTDYDFVPQSILALFLLLLVYGKEKKGPLLLQRDILIANVLLLLSVVFITFFCKGFVSYSHPTFMVFWFALVALCMGSSLFLWRRPAYFLRHPERRVIPVAICLACSGLISRTVFDFLWEPVAHLTGIVTHEVLRTLLPSLQYRLHYVTTPLRVDEYSLLSHPNFAISIGRGCGGLDGIFLFLCVLLFFVTADRKRFRPMNCLMVVPLGVAYMYFLNVFRLSLFFLMSLGAIGMWGANTGTYVVTAMFHHSMSWILYSLGLWFFFSLLLRYRGRIDTQISRKSLLPSLSSRRDFPEEA